MMTFQDADLQSPEWVVAAVPHATGRAAENRENAVWPHSRVKKDR